MCKAIIFLQQKKLETPSFHQHYHRISKTNMFKYSRNIKIFFAWRYKYLKTYDTSTIEHKIPLKPRSKSFQQKL